MFTGYCVLLAHGAAAQLSPCQHSSLKPPRRVPIGLHSLPAILINAHTVPQVKYKQHLSAPKVPSLNPAAGMGKEAVHKVRDGVNVSPLTGQMPDIQEGNGVEEAPAAEGAPGWYSLGMAPEDSLWSFCSRIGPAS